MGAIYDWQDMDSEGLKKAIELLNKLEELGIQGCSDEMYDAMKAELKKRLKVSELELIDSLTNVVMDILRPRFNIDRDSDQDDQLYGEIHTAIKATYREITKQN